MKKVMLLAATVALIALGSCRETKENDDMTETETLIEDARENGGDVKVKEDKVKIETADGDEIKIKTDDGGNVKVKTDDNN